MVVANKSTPEYEWILCHSPSNDDPFAPLEKIGTLHKAKSRQFQLVKNRAGTASFQIRTNDQLAEAILDQVDMNDIRGTVRKCIRIRRNKQDLWSGPIWGIQGALAAGTLAITCVGWMERLYSRMLWPALALDYSNAGSGTSTDTIIAGLMAAINSQNLAYPLLVQAPSSSIVGSIVGTMPIRNRYYQRGTMLGPAIQELSDIEAGADINVDPVSRQLQLAAWDTYKSAEGWWGGVRDNIVLGYNCGNKILKDVQWQEDPSRIVNNAYIQSLGAPVGPIYDQVSLDTYGPFEELMQPSQMNQNLLQPYGVAELVIRSRPLVTWTVIPHPRMGTQGPTLFDDFQIGDQIKFSAIKDYVKIKRQSVRVFGATINLDDNGNETISALQLTPQAAGGA